MKKFLAILLGLGLSFSLIACGDATPDLNPDGNGNEDGGSDDGSGDENDVVTPVLEVTTTSFTINVGDQIKSVLEENIKTATFDDGSDATSSVTITSTGLYDLNGFAISAGTFKVTYSLIELTTTVEKEVSVIVTEKEVEEITLPTPIGMSTTTNNYLLTFTHATLRTEISELTGLVNADMPSNFNLVYDFYDSDNDEHMFTYKKTLGANANGCSVTIANVVIELEGYMKGLGLSENDTLNMYATLYVEKSENSTLSQKINNSEIVTFDTFTYTMPEVLGSPFRYTTFWQDENRAYANLAQGEIGLFSNSESTSLSGSLEGDTFTLFGFQSKDTTWWGLQFLGRFDYVPTPGRYEGAIVINSDVSGWITVMGTQYYLTAGEDTRIDLAYDYANTNGFLKLDIAFGQNGRTDSSNTIGDFEMTVQLIGLTKIPKPVLEIEETQMNLNINSDAEAAIRNNISKALLGNESDATNLVDIKVNGNNSLSYIDTTKPGSYIVTYTLIEGDITIERTLVLTIMELIDGKEVLPTLASLSSNGVSIKTAGFNSDVLFNFNSDGVTTNLLEKLSITLEELQANLKYEFVLYNASTYEIISTVNTIIGDETSLPTPDLFKQDVESYMLENAIFDLTLGGAAKIVTTESNNLDVLNSPLSYATQTFTHSIDDPNEEKLNGSFAYNEFLSASTGERDLLVGQVAGWVKDDEATLTTTLEENGDIKLVATQKPDSNFYQVQFFAKFNPVETAGKYSETITITSDTAGVIKINGSEYALKIGENVINLEFKLSAGQNSHLSIQFGTNTNGQTTIGDFTATISGLTKSN